MKKRIKSVVVIILLVLMSVFITGCSVKKIEPQYGLLEEAEYSAKISISFSDILEEEGVVAEKADSEEQENISGIESELVNFINEENTPNNIVFTYGVSKAKSLSEFDNIQGHIAHDEPQTRRILIEWVWEYETGKESEEITANDIIDTQDGITLDEYTFDIVVTAAQSN